MSLRRRSRTLELALVASAIRLTCSRPEPDALRFLETAYDARRALRSASFAVETRQLDDEGAEVTAENRMRAGVAFGRKPLPREGRAFTSSSIAVRLRAKGAVQGSFPIGGPRSRVVAFDPEVLLIRDDAARRLLETPPSWSDPKAEFSIWSPE